MDRSTRRRLACSFVLMLLSSPAFAQTGAAPGGDAAQPAPKPSDSDIYCRPPQQLADSIMKGPKVCMPLGRWKEYRSKGLDVSADGKSLQQMGTGSVGSGTAYDLRPQP